MKGLLEGNLSLYILFSTIIVLYFNLKFIYKTLLLKFQGSSKVLQIGVPVEEGEDKEY